MRAVVASLIVVAIGVVNAHADPLAAVELPALESCATAFGCARTAGPGGQATARVRWRVGPRAVLVGIAETAERPVGAQLASQAIVALGERRLVGRGWIEVGVGLAASQLATCSVEPGRLLDTQARPAFVAGFGARVWRGLAFSIAAGSSADQALYQLTASVEARWR